ncbi:hypothetical protein IRJ41_009831 [Triplophysa rosa]|uniref:Uncharacterized protein n=1 Tax=Triplophysa rosa TaxID=992332 RepID=A0A9W7TMV1_TRIRA|nr:hypothetical protein IRJ41_009831 [Triplophysa rosa]
MVVVQISRMQDSCLSGDTEVMDPSIVTIDSKLLKDLSMYLIMSASTVEDFCQEVFNKVVCILDPDEINLEATHEDARRITQEVLLKVQSRIDSGTLILMAEDKPLPDDAMQSVISDLLRLLEDEATSPEPHDEPEGLCERVKENKTKAVKRFRITYRIKTPSSVAFAPKLKKTERQCCGFIMARLRLVVVMDNGSTLCAVLLADYSCFALQSLRTTSWTCETI